MKKVYLLSGMIVFGVAARMHAMQQERPAIYKMIDQLSKHQDWPAIFHFLDSMEGVINVNEYTERTYGYTLLMKAISQEKLLVAKTLLEKYKADPNKPVKQSGHYLGMTPLIQACWGVNDLAMVKLLLLYGADPNQKDAKGKNSFNYAKKNPEILKELNKFKMRGRESAAAA